MATTSWKTAANGNWRTASAWSTGVAPKSAATDVTLGLVGAYTVSLLVTDAFGIGALTVSNPAATLFVAGALTVSNLTNAGTITVSSATGNLLIGGAAANAGRINVANGGALWLLQGGALANTGSIALSSGGALLIASPVTLAGLGALDSAGGVVDLYDAGALDLGGAGIAVAPTGAFSNLALDGGALRHGRVTASGGALALHGTLDGIAWTGPLSLGQGDALTLVGGFALATSTGAPGTLTLAGGRLVVGDAETLDRFTLLATPPAGGFSYLQNAAALDGVPAGTLGFGSQFVFRQTAGETFLQDPAGSEAANAGQFQIAGGTLHVLDGSFANSGTVALGNGAVMQVGSFTTLSNSGLLLANGGGNGLLTFNIAAVGASFVNLAGGVLTGGSYRAEAGSTLEIGGPCALVTANANLALDGVGSAMRFYDPVAGKFTDIRTTLATVGGTLSLSGGVTFTDTLALRDAGRIVLANGTLSTPTLTVASGATLSGFGSVTGPRSGASVIAGSVLASGGRLSFAGPITGAGTLRIAAGATLEIGSSDTAGVVFAGVAALQLDSVTPIAGAISGLVAGDTIRLQRTSATAATLAGGKLTVTLARGGPEVFTASGAAGLGVQVSQDGAGNSTLTFVAPAPAALARSASGYAAPSLWPSPPPMPAAPLAAWHPPAVGAALPDTAPAPHALLLDLLAMLSHGATP